MQRDRTDSCNTTSRSRRLSSPRRTSGCDEPGETEVDQLWPPRSAAAAAAAAAGDSEQLRIPATDRVHPMAVRTDRVRPAVDTADMVDTGWHLDHLQADLVVAVFRLLAVRHHKELHWWSVLQNTVDRSMLVDFRWGGRRRFCSWLPTTTNTNLFASDPCVWQTAIYIPLLDGPETMDKIRIIWSVSPYIWAESFLPSRCHWQWFFVPEVVLARSFACCI